MEDNNSEDPSEIEECDSQKIGNSDDSGEENGLQQIMTHQRHGERSLFSFVTSRYERFSSKFRCTPLYRTIMIFMVAMATRDAFQKMRNFIRFHVIYGC